MRQNVDSFPVSSHSPYGRGLYKGTVSGLWKRWKFPPVTWAHNPSGQPQFIFRPANYKRPASWRLCLIPGVSYPIDNFNATSLGLCRSLDKMSSSIASVNRDPHIADYASFAHVHHLSDSLNGRPVSQIFHPAFSKKCQRQLCSPLLKKIPNTLHASLYHFSKFTCFNSVRPDQSIVVKMHCYLFSLCLKRQ